MRKKYTYLLLLLFTTSFAVRPVFAQEKSTKLDEYLTALSRMRQFNGCVAVLANGKLIFDKAYTMPGPASLRVGKNSQFDIHSVSKLMGKAVLVKMQAEGKLRLSDPVSKFLPGFPRGNAITLQMLVDHRSGLPRELTKVHSGKLKMTGPEIVAAAALEKLEFEPGTGMRYSNVGYELIYQIIAQQTGHPFVAELKKLYFDPLGMSSSGARFYLPHANLLRAAQNHQLKDGKIVAVPNVTDDEFKTARVYSTTSDLLKFLTLMNKAPYLSTLSDSSGIIEKNGGSDGIRAQIWTNTRLHYSFVLLSNYDEWPFQQTIADLVSILEDKPYTVPAPVSRQSVAIAVDLPQNYAGTYDFAEANHTLIEFRAAPGKLQTYQGGEKQADLAAESDTVFFDDPKSKDGFTFRRDGDHWKVIWSYKGIQLTGKRK